MPAGAALLELTEDGVSIVGIGVLNTAVGMTMMDLPEVVDDEIGAMLALLIGTLLANTATATFESGALVTLGDSLLLLVVAATIGCDTG